MIASGEFDTATIANYSGVFSSLELSVGTFEIPNRPENRLVIERSALQFPILGGWAPTCCQSAERPRVHFPGRRGPIHGSNRSRDLNHETNECGNNLRPTDYARFNCHDTPNLSWAQPKKCA